MARYKTVTFKPRWCIYALTDPFTQEIRYVGRTWNVQRRYKQHLSNTSGTGRERLSPFPKNEWVASLFRKGLLPGLRILEFTSERRSAAAERRWVSMLLVDGHRLCNWHFTRGDEPEMYHI